MEEFDEQDFEHLQQEARALAIQQFSILGNWKIAKINNYTIKIHTRISKWFTNF